MAVLLSLAVLVGIIKLRDTIPYEMEDRDDYENNNTQFKKLNNTRVTV